MNVQKWPKDATLRQSIFLHDCPYCRCQKAPQPSLYLYPLSQTQTNFTLFSKTGHLAYTFPRRKNNLIFSYQSPNKLQRHHSDEARFSTKRYKDKHFPHIGKVGEQEKPLLSIPVRKPKANQQEIVKSQSNLAKAQLGRQDWRLDQNRKKKVAAYVQHRDVENYSSRIKLQTDNKATPIQYLKEFPKQQLPISHQNSNSNYQSERSERQSNRLIQEQFQDNQSLAASISEELQLHYDYYSPKEQTDQSLSAYVQL